MAKIPNSSRYKTSGSADARRGAAPNPAPRMNQQGANSGTYTANQHQAHNPAGSSVSIGWILLGLIGLGILITRPIVALAIVAMALLAKWLAK